MLLFDKSKLHVLLEIKNQSFYMPGIADDTLFTMTCIDWIEWNVTSQNLKYEYRIASYGSDRCVEYRVTSYGRDICVEYMMNMLDSWSIFMPGGVLWQTIFAVLR